MTSKLTIYFNEIEASISKSCDVEKLAPKGYTLEEFHCNSLGIIEQFTAVFKNENYKPNETT